MNSLWKRIWTEINLDNLIYNFNSIKSNISSDTLMCCVVKANAYGHHAPRVAQALEAAGADWFAVSNIEEAVQLRNEGISHPIVILGYTPVECANILAAYDISQCVYSLEYAKQLSLHCQKNKCSVKIHIKVDTGMGRIGFQCDDVMTATDEIALACSFEGLTSEGIFTHFAVSDCGENGRDFSNLQHEKFCELIECLDAKGIHFSLKHCSNSAAVLDYPELQMNMVRVGIILYGLLPSHNTCRIIPLKPVMSLKTIISHIKTVNKGATISYGCDFIADREMTVATVPMGYADGFFRSSGNNAVDLLVHGQKARIIGRICMDQLMLDVSGIENVAIGDEVTVFGDESFINTVDDLALKNGTINYEIICSVGKRVPRVFIKNSTVDSVHLGVLDTTVN